MKRLTLPQKLFLGYLLMVALTVLVGVYAVVRLNTIRQINQDLVRIDLPFIEATGAMMETLSAQELYAKKYAILNDPTTERLFWRRVGEYSEQLSRLQPTDGEIASLQDRLTELHREYQGLFLRLSATLARKDPGAATALIEGPMQAQMDRQIQLVQQAERQAREALERKVRMGHLQNQEGWTMMIIVSLVSLGVGLTFASFATYRISHSIRQIKETAQRIGREEYEQLPTLEHQDVIGDLGDSLRWMTGRIKEMGERRLDANPLTRLPGTRAVEQQLLLRLRTTSPFAFCYIDLKDFKAFGDRYGFSRGSEVLRRVGQILIEAVRVLGRSGDFVGHIGGDDFVLITEPERVDTLSERIIREFDHLIPSFYDEEDRRRGYILAHNRKNMMELFSIMTISIAVVTTDRSTVPKPSEVAELAARLKQKAKRFDRSTYVVQKQSS